MRARFSDRYPAQRLEGVSLGYSTISALQPAAIADIVSPGPGRPPAPDLPHPGAGGAAPEGAGGRGRCLSRAGGHLPSSRPVPRALVGPPDLLQRGPGGGVPRGQAAGGQGGPGGGGGGDPGGAAQHSLPVGPSPPHPFLGQDLLQPRRGGGGGGGGDPAGLPARPPRRPAPLPRPAQALLRAAPRRGPLGQYGEVPLAPAPPPPSSRHRCVGWTLATAALLFLVVICSTPGPCSQALTAMH